MKKFGIFMLTSILFWSAAPAFAGSVITPLPSRNLSDRELTAFAIQQVGELIKKNQVEGLNPYFPVTSIDVTETSYFGVRTLELYVRTGGGLCYFTATAQVISQIDNDSLLTTAASPANCSD
jgi:hypothetical protein